MATEVLYLGRDNTIDLLLKRENDAGVSEAVDLANVTQIDAIFRADTNVTVSSSGEASGPIRWNQVGYADGEIRIEFSSVQEADLSEGLYPVTIVTFDANNTDGIIFGEIGVKVKLASG